MSLTRDDLRRYEGIVSSLRVNELQSILVVFNLPKLGKKQELIHRCFSLLHTPSSQIRFITAVDDLMRRTHSGPSARSAPYPQQLVQRVTNGFGGGPSNVYNQNPVALMANRQPTLRFVRGLRPMVLPFYDLLGTIVEPVELPSMNGTVKTVKQTITFGLDSNDILEFKDKREKDLPRVELQLRFFNITGDYQNTEQADDFPLNCFVRLDDQVVLLPNVIPTNKPNAEPKRPSRPVNITVYCNPPRPITVPHAITVEWTSDRRSWACGVYKVRRVTSQILFDRANNNESVRLSSEITKQTIIRRLSVGDDDGISLSQIRVSLLCPLGKIRMTLPARGRECTHLQCFDLKLFLDMNEKRPTWKCAVCSGPCHYNNLIIDGYFESILRTVPSSVTEVELLRDGGYSTVKEEVFPSSDEEGDDIVSLDGPSTSVPNQKPAPIAPVHPKPKPEDDIITIDDSDDDLDVQRAVEDSVRKMNNQGSGDLSAKAPYPSSPSSSDNSIIVLDDTPPRRNPPQRFVNTQPNVANTDSTVPATVPTSMGSNQPPVSQPSLIAPPSGVPNMNQGPTLLPSSNHPANNRVNMGFDQFLFRTGGNSNTLLGGMTNFPPQVNRLPMWPGPPGFRPTESVGQNGMNYPQMGQNALIGRQQQFPSNFTFRSTPGERFDSGPLNLAQALQNLQKDTGFTDYRNS